jgi:hypothetical protein
LDFLEKKIKKISVNSINFSFNLIFFGNKIAKLLIQNFEKIKKKKEKKLKSPGTCVM